MKYKCDECGPILCTASYPFDCNRPEKTAKMSKWKEVKEQIPNCSICQWVGMHFLNRVCLGQGSANLQTVYNNSLCKGLFEPAVTEAGPEKDEPVTTREILENAKSKEPELMTLQEAAKLCTKKGDKIYSANGEYGILFEHFGQHGGFLVRELLRCEKWYFKPAEQKVLNANEIRTKVTAEDPHKDLQERLRDILIAIYKDHHDSERLMMWIMAVMTPLIEERLKQEEYNKRLYHHDSGKIKTIRGREGWM